jgi:hypothetical protein
MDWERVNDRLCGQSSWLQIQRPGFDSRRYQIFWDVMGLEWGPFSLVSTIEELLERKCSGSGLEIREYGRMDPSRWPRGTLNPQKLALTYSTIGCCSVGIVLSWTQATEFFFQPQFVSMVYSVSNRNKYQDSSSGQGLPARKSDNLTIVCEPTV